MSNKEKLYDAFGELVYVVAMTDGIIQAEEKKALHDIISNHTWASEIEWSFNYEVEKQQDVDYLYKKVLDYCHQNGPDPEYQFLIEILEAVAMASTHKDDEIQVINKFTSELTARFKRDIDKLNKREEED
ncbi:MAG: hypothetical protein P1P88_24815 [Bacteroidales bacterium]|nr:hypothetical protein [Bacteroidales bacterium]